MGREVEEFRPHWNEGHKKYISKEGVLEVESIGGDASFYDSLVKDLGKLESIGGNANFSYSQIEDLGKLESIGGDAWFEYSQVKDLGNLESIGKDIHLDSFNLLFSL